jgi:CheY-like chemotaxis protein
MSVSIAVIDDDSDIVELVKATLKSRGFEVKTASDGEEGLRLIQSARPDLVVLDLMMPKVSGLEVVRRMREDPATRDIPIIVLSAIGEKTGKPEEFWRVGLGAEDFISKPFDPLALLGRVEYVLRRREYVSQRPAGSSGAQGAVRVPRTSLQDSTPREIVRCFVEAWNGQNFGDEFNCLTGPMRGSIEKGEYILRRRQAYAEEAPAPHRQRLASVVEEEIGTDKARVLVEREDTYGQRKNRRREEYSLNRTPDGWKITTVRVVPK